MSEKVIIEINSQLTDQEGQTDSIGFITEGTIYRKNERVFLSYKEQLSGMEGVLTTIRAGEGEVVLIRQGECTVRQVFREGKPDINSYETPFGELPMVILPERVEYDFCGNNGRLYLEYDLDISGEFASHNTVEIKVRGKGANGSSGQGPAARH